MAMVERVTAGSLQVRERQPKLGEMERQVERPQSFEEGSRQMGPRVSFLADRRADLERSMLQESLYSDAAGAFGVDVTSEYCEISREGIEFVKKFLGKPKIVCIIRDLVERAISQIKMNMGRRGISYSSVDNWTAAASDPVVAVRGDYVIYVPRWDQSELQVLYIPFQSISTNPEGTLRSVEAFCGLRKANYPDLSNRVFSSFAVTVPDHVRGMLAEKLKLQTDYLISRFGKEFCAQI